MKVLNTIIIVGLSLLIANPVLAGDRKHSKNSHKFYDHARVIDVETIYRTVRVSQPRQECWNEERTAPITVTRERRHGSDGDVIIGGIIGGVLGHQLGGGRGKDAATIAGTLIGAAVAHDQGSSRTTVETGRYRTESKEHCRTYTDYHTEERPDGYRVTYRYHGEVFHTQMKHRPGNRIKVKVRVTPIED